jgi:hypothetical protein
LGGHDGAVEQRDGEQVGKAVVGLLLGGDLFSVRAVESTAGEVERDLRDVGLDRDHVVGPECLLPNQLDHAKNGRLGVDLRVVLLDRAADDPLVPFVLPVDLDTQVQEVVDPVGSLDHGEWALHPAAGEDQIAPAGAGVLGGG